MRDVFLELSALVYETLMFLSESRADLLNDLRNTSHGIISSLGIHPYNNRKQHKRKYRKQRQYPHKFFIIPMDH
jgi:hypothetical protein